MISLFWFFISIMTGDTEEIEQGDVVGEQLILLDSVQKILRNFKKDPVARKTEAYHNARLDSLASYRTEFRANHRILARQSQDAEVKEAYIDGEVCDKFEEIYIDAVAVIRDSLAAMTRTVAEPKRDNSDAATVSCATNQVANCVALPEVKLPTFSGNHIDWPAFKEIFLDRIHQNESLSFLQRFH